MRPLLALAAITAAITLVEGELFSPSLSSTDDSRSSRRLAQHSDPVTKPVWETKTHFVQGDRRDAYYAEDCPKGHYRAPEHGPGNYGGECTECPRGKYGDVQGLISSDCTDDCPKGTYRDLVGGASIHDCSICPMGTYGEDKGLTTPVCSGYCPEGTYSNTPGLERDRDCKDCPPGYRGHQCFPRRTWDHSSPGQEAYTVEDNKGNLVYVHSLGIPSTNDWQ